MPAPGPGVWQLPAGQYPLSPWASRLRPFMPCAARTSSGQARRPRSPAARTRADFNEIKALGSVDSAARTAEQTTIARF